MPLDDVVSRLKAAGASRSAALNEVVQWIAPILKGQLSGDSLKDTLTTKAGNDGVEVPELAEALETILVETPGNYLATISLTVLVATGLVITSASFPTNDVFIGAVLGSRLFYEFVSWREATKGEGAQFQLEVEKAASKGEATEATEEEEEEPTNEGVKTSAGTMVKELVASYTKPGRAKVKIADGVVYDLGGTDDDQIQAAIMEKFEPLYSAYSLKLGIVKSTMNDIQLELATMLDSADTEAKESAASLVELKEQNTLMEEQVEASDTALQDAKRSSQQAQNKSKTAKREIEEMKGKRAAINANLEKAKAKAAETRFLFAGVDLTAMDFNGKSDPFFEVHIEEEVVYKSEIIKKTLNPTWKPFNLKNDVAAKGMLIKVFDWDRFSKNDFIGEVALTMANFRGEVETHLGIDEVDPMVAGWALLNPRKEGTRGYVNSGKLKLVEMTENAKDDSDVAAPTTGGDAEGTTEEP